MGRVVVAVAAVLAAALAGVLPASAHPDGPFVTASYVRSQFFSPGPSKYDDRSLACSGFGTHRGNGFRHFRCRSVRKDGLVSTFLVHSTPSGFEFGFMESSGQADLARKRVLKSKVVSGDVVVITVSGQAENPAIMAVRVWTSPDQYVRIHWSVVCSDDDGSAASKSGSLRTANLGEAQIELPFIRPTDCSAAASVSMATPGRLKVQLVAYVF
jgi:hypothetical protein